MKSTVTVWDCNGTGIFKADIRKNLRHQN